MFLTINNKKTPARDFYFFKYLEAKKCFSCEESQSQLYEIKDGFDSVICGLCLSQNLEDLNCSDDFYCNDFNKKIMSDRYIDKNEWF